MAILPASIVLRGPKAPARAVVVERSEGGQFTGEVTKGVVFRSSDPKVMRISNSVVIPVGDGTATLHAVWQGHTASVPVTVEQHNSDAPWSFRNHVQSVLTKAGCNSGRCTVRRQGKMALSCPCTATIRRPIS